MYTGTKPLPDGIEGRIQPLVRPGRLCRGGGEEVGLRTRGLLEARESYPDQAHRAAGEAPRGAGGAHPPPSKAPFPSGQAPS